MNKEDKVCPMCFGKGVIEVCKTCKGTGSIIEHDETCYKCIKCPDCCSNVYEITYNNWCFE